MFGFAVLAAIVAALTACNEDLGEDEDKFTAVVGSYSYGIRLANNSKSSVSVTINNAAKTISAYGGSGEYPHVTYNLNEGTYTVYYTPSSKVRVSGAGGNNIIFYNK